MRRVGVLATPPATGKETKALLQWKQAQDSKKARRRISREQKRFQKGTMREQEGPYRDTKKAKTKPKREVHLVVNQMSRDFLGNPGSNSGSQTSSKYAKAGWLATEQQTGAR